MPTDFARNAKNAFMPPVNNYKKQATATIHLKETFDLTINQRHHLLSKNKIQLPTLNCNGPLFNWLWQPLNHLPGTTGAKVWFVKALISLLLGLYLMVQAFPYTSSLTLPTVAIIALMLPSVFRSFAVQQVGGLVMLLVGWLANLYTINLPTNIVRPK